MFDKSNVILKPREANNTRRWPKITVKQYDSPLANKTEAHFLTECASCIAFFFLHFEWLLKNDLNANFFC